MSPFLVRRITVYLRRHLKLRRQRGSEDVRKAVKTTLYDMLESEVGLSEEDAKVFESHFRFVFSTLGIDMITEDEVFKYFE